MGYIGYRRSERSQNAIEGYEVPLSMINRELINEYFRDYGEDYKEEDIKALKGLSIAVIKFVARREVGRSSWHHTSSMYNETDHYSLQEVFEYTLDTGIDNIIDLYKNYIKRVEKEKAEEQKSYEYVKISVEMWGRRNGKFKFLYNETIIGLLVGDWIYYYDSISYTKIRKYGRYSRAVTIESKEKDYKSFVKANKEYTGKSKLFNKLIKDLKAKGTIKGN